MKRLITAELVTAEAHAGRRVIAVPAGSAIITPGAWSAARELGVTLDASVQAEGSCERVVDPSGVQVVRGDSVQLGRFTGAGPDKNVGLLDVISSAQGAPMTAGIMSFASADAFAWRLTYDEIDLVLEGVLHITIGGRVIEGRAGDVLYVPKGSDIIFGTPHRTRVFYVTYPADWAAPAPVRPQR